MTHAEQVAAVLKIYENKGKSLFAPGGTRALNSWAAAFWAGYDGMTKGVRVPSRGSLVYAWYAAGRKARATSTAGGAHE